MEGSLESQGLDAENDTYTVNIMIDDLDTTTLAWAREIVARYGEASDSSNNAQA